MIISEVSILAESIDAYREFELLCDERSCFKLWPNFFFWVPRLTITELFLLLLGLIFIVFGFVLLLLLDFFGDFTPVSNGCVESVLRKAGVVDERNCHEATESWYFPEMKTIVRHQALHIDELVLIGGDNIIFFWYCVFAVLTFRYWLRVIFFWFEKVVADTLFWVKDFSNHELVVRTGMFEF